MKRTLADPTVTADSQPFWLGEGWTTRRRASSGTGSAGEGDGDTGGDDGTEGEDGDEDDDNAGDEEGAAGDDGKVDKTEYDKMVARMKAADKAKSAAEKRLRDIDDAQKSELDKANDKVESLTKTNAEQATTIGKMRVENAFLKVADITWKKPAAALKLAAADGYFDEVTDEDGAVDQKKFAKKVAEFAKAYPELVKEDGEGDAGSNGRGSGGSGAGVGSGRGAGRGTGATGPSDKELKRKYSRVLR